MERLPDGDYAISVITEMELLSYPGLDAESEANIRAFISGMERIWLSEGIIQSAIDPGAGMDSNCLTPSLPQAR